MIGSTRRRNVSILDVNFDIFCRRVDYIDMC
jgi:hypothetical protein